MQSTFRVCLALAACFGLSSLQSGCGAPPTVSNTNTAWNLSSNTNSIVSNSSNSNTKSASAVVETKEPEQYEATVTIKIEALGDLQKTAVPTLGAKVARSGNDRRMEFSMPAGGRVVFLDKAGMNYLLLPDKKQFAELNRDSLGFDVRRMLMPEQIVEQIKNVQGVERVGDDTYNGRDVVKYRYGAVTDTQTRAGQVGTESLLYVDKQTGLPLHSETVSQTQSGDNVQGYKGLRVITEITDINIAPVAELFDKRADLQKIESDQVRAQVDMIFNAFATFLTQMMKQGQAGSPTPTP